MRIRITTAFVDGMGPALQNGDLLNADDDKALDLIARGFAIAVGDTPAQRMEASGRAPLAELRGKVAAIVNRNQGSRRARV